MRFTFVSEKGDGLFVEQVDAGDVDTALRRWYEVSSTEPVGLLDTQDPYYDSPVAIEGLSGVWCHGGHDADEEFILTHFVATTMPSGSQGNESPSTRSGSENGPRVAPYTIILDWDGGTYLSQLRAESPDQAVRRWAEELNVGPIPRMGAAAKRQLNDQLRQDGCAPIDGLVSTWRCSALVRGKVAWVHVVRTEVRISEQAPVNDA